MGVKYTGIFLITLLVGSLAIPSPQNEDMSQLFIHADPEARIVGGIPAPEGSVPYMLAMTQGAIIRSLLCGGSLITPRTVLTAAHCIAAVFNFGTLSSSLQVTAGSNSWSTGGQRYNIERNVTHEHYVSATIKNDIGILITATPVVFSGVVGPITLGMDWAEGGITSRAAGWGRIAQGAAISPVLLELYVLTIEGDRCVTEVAEAAAAANMVAPPVEPHIELCTFHSPGHGMCNGDSGSALVRVDRREQIGIVSWGIPCARGAPDMFVRVSAYIDWVEHHAV